MQLSVININKSFKMESGVVDVLRNINFTVKSGEFLCIIGPSGCGKSTLINIIAGLEKATKGMVEYNGNIINSPGPDRAVIFQDAALFPWLNVIENVELGMKISGLSKKERKEKAFYYLDMVHLTNFKDYSIHQLSGGMKQKVALARALSLESKILLMDEPFASVDNQTRDILHHEVLKIWENTQKTIIFITHNIDEAVQLADKIIIMSPRPSRIKKEIGLSMKRPRNNEEGLINDIKRELQYSAESEGFSKLGDKKGSVLPDFIDVMGDGL